MTDPDLSPSRAPNQERQILSVSELNRKARQLLEIHLPMLWVEGEVSNFVRPSSGHWYFTLKDDGAQVRCAMFRNRNRLTRFAPKVGEKVVVRARAGLYEGRGEYQLIVEHMEQAGFGALQRAFEALKAKLQQEGLFDPAHKKQVPYLPRRIGVVTSPTGAAVQDIVSVLKRRFPSIPVAVLPVAVQGRDAPAEIAAAIDRANRHQACDVLIVGRGGGSLEDLWAFNEEVVARAIHKSAIPVVSAVGHEIDFSIADFVADVRAPTPSAAAELLSPDQEVLRASFSECFTCLERGLTRRLQAWWDTVAHLRARLQHPGQRLRNHSQRLDHLELRLHSESRSRLTGLRQQITTLQQRLSMVHPGRQLAREADKVTQLRARLERQMELAQQRKAERLARTADLLDSVSPLATLRRGYAIVESDAGIVRSATQVTPGQHLEARLKDGVLSCTVDTVARDNGAD